LAKPALPLVFEPEGAGAAAAAAGFRFRTGACVCVRASASLHNRGRPCPGARDGSRATSIPRLPLGIEASGVPYQARRGSLRDGFPVLRRLTPAARESRTSWLVLHHNCLSLAAASVDPWMAYIQACARMLHPRHSLVVKGARLCLLGLPVTRLDNDANCLFPSYRPSRRVQLRCPPANAVHLDDKGLSRPRSKCNDLSSWLCTTGALKMDPKASNRCCRRVSGLPRGSPSPAC
jgi:hypothetical protein